MSSNFTAPEMTAILNALLNAIRVGLKNGTINEDLVAHEASIINVLAARNKMAKDVRQIFKRVPALIWHICTEWKKAGRVLTTEAIAEHKLAFDELEKKLQTNAAKNDTIPATDAASTSSAVAQVESMNTDVTMEAAEPLRMPPSTKKKNVDIPEERPTPMTPTPAPRGDGAKIVLPMSKLKLGTPMSVPQVPAMRPLNFTLPPMQTVPQQAQLPAANGQDGGPPTTQTTMGGNELSRRVTPKPPPTPHAPATSTRPRSPTIDRGEGPSTRAMTPVQKILRKPRKAHKPPIILPTPIPRRRKVNGRYIEIDDDEEDEDVKEDDNDAEDEDDDDDGSSDTENDSDEDHSGKDADDRMDVVKVKKEKKEPTLPRGRPINRTRARTKSRPRNFRCGSTRREPPCARCAGATEKTTCFEQHGQTGGACYACSKMRKRCVPHGEEVPVQRRRKSDAPAHSRSRKTSYRKIKSPPQSSPPRLSAKAKGKQREETIPQKPATRQRKQQREEGLTNGNTNGEELAERIAAILAEQMKEQERRMDRRIEEMLRTVTNRLDHLEQHILALHDDRKEDPLPEDVLIARPATNGMNVDEADISVRQQLAGTQFRTLAEETPPPSSDQDDNAMDVDNEVMANGLAATPTIVVGGSTPPLVEVTLPPAVVIVPPTPQNSQETIALQTQETMIVVAPESLAVPGDGSAAATFLAALAAQENWRRERASSLVNLRRSPRLEPPMDPAIIRSRSTSNPLRWSGRNAPASKEAAQEILRQLNNAKERRATPNPKKRHRDQDDDESSKRQRRT